MANFLQKQPSSRAGRAQVTALATAQTQVSVIASTTFGPETYQIRVYHTLANTVWASIGDSTQTAAAATGIPIPGAQQWPEYFTVTPGQQISVYSTSTSTGYFSVTEMS